MKVFTLLPLLWLVLSYGIHTNSNLTLRATDPAPDDRFAMKVWEPATTNSRTAAKFREDPAYYLVRTAPNNIPTQPDRLFSYLTSIARGHYAWYKGQKGVYGTGTRAVLVSVLYVPTENVLLVCTSPREEHKSQMIIQSVSTPEWVKKMGNMFLKNPDSDSWKRKGAAHGYNYFHVEDLCHWLYEFEKRPLLPGGRYPPGSWLVIYGKYKGSEDNGERRDPCSTFRSPSCWNVAVAYGLLIEDTGMPSAPKPDPDPQANPRPTPEPELPPDDNDMPPLTEEEIAACNEAAELLVQEQGQRRRQVGPQAASDCPFLVYPQNFTSDSVPYPSDLFTDNVSPTITPVSTSAPSCTLHNEDPDNGLNQAYCLCDGKTLAPLSVPMNGYPSDSCAYTTIPPSAQISINTLASVSSPDMAVPTITPGPTTAPSCTLHNQDPDQGLNQAYCLCDGKILTPLPVPTDGHPSDSCAYTTIPSSAQISVTTIANSWTDRCAACTEVALNIPTCTTVQGCSSSTGTTNCRACTEAPPFGKQCTQAPGCTPSKALVEVVHASRRVYVGTVTADALSKTVSSALNSICPTYPATATGFIGCSNEVAKIDGVDFVELGFLSRGGELSIETTLTQYNSSKQRQALIDTVSLAFKLSTEQDYACFNATFYTEDPRRDVTLPWFPQDHVHDSTDFSKRQGVLIHHQRHCKAPQVIQAIHSTPWAVKFEDKGYMMAELSFTEVGSLIDSLCLIVDEVAIGMLAVLPEFAALEVEVETIINTICDKDEEDE